MIQSRRCLRARLFRLVDGTGQNDHRTFFVGIHDFDADETIDARKVEGLVKSTFQRNGTILLSLTIQTFDFHRDFSASEYRSPTSVDVGEASLVDANDGSKGRL